MDVVSCIRHLFTSWKEKEEAKEHLIVNRSPPSERMCRWSELPGDICCLIDLHLTFPPHSHKFAAICKNWYDAAKQNRKYDLYKQTPMLLLPYNEQTKTCTFVQLEDFSTYELKFHDLSNMWICGAFYGWLASISSMMDFVMFNPLIQVKVPLPRLNPIKLFTRDWDWEPMVEFSEQHVMVSKMTVSDDPSFSENYMFAIICNDESRVAVARLGDEDWSIVIDSCIDGALTNNFYDIVFYEGKLCAVSEYNIAVIDCCKSVGFTSKLIATPEQEEESTEQPQTAYLVPSLGYLLLVQRFVKMKRWYNKTYKFQVFRLERETETWTKISNLGGQSLFLGPNRSVSISAGMFSWCKHNCIYFTNDCHFTIYDGYQWDSGVFNMDDASFETFDHIQHSLSEWPSPAMWYL